MKKLIKGALFLAIAGTTIVGCEKEENEINQSIFHDSVDKTKPLNNKSNSGNLELSMEEINNIAEMHNVKLAHIHDQSYSLSELEQKQDSILLSYDYESVSNQDMLNWSANVGDVNSIESFKGLFDFEYEKDYIQAIDNIIATSENYSTLSYSIDSICDVIVNDAREMRKTPIILFGKTSKESFFYWAPTSIGGSGDGQNYIGNATERSVARADGMAAAGGFLYLAGYGAWGALFGPAGFALGGAAVVAVGVRAGIASALYAAST